MTTKAGRKKAINLISRFDFKDKWDFLDLSNSQKYYWERICLTGDSAHASTPHLGAGVVMSFERSRGAIMERR